MIPKSVSFMKWLGQEFKEFFKEGKEYYGDEKNFFGVGKKLVAEANIRFEDIPVEEKRKILQLFTEYHKTRIIGNYRIRYDLRDEGDFCEEIIATLEGIVENETNTDLPG